MKRTSLSILILTPALVLTFLAARAAAGPQTGKESQKEQAAKHGATPEPIIYRVSYKLSEVENGKTINSRSYTLMAQAEKRASARIGSRIPVVFQSKLDYHDVGMAFSCTIRQQEHGLVVHSEFNMNTVANREPASSPMSPPVLRQFFLEDDTVATMGKPAFVGSVDDVASNRHYVIEVTVTKAE